MRIIKYDKKKTGNVKHREKEQNKALYVEFCEDGYTYADIIELMELTPSTITRYALETNTIPSIKNFDRNQLYQLLFDKNQTKLKKDAKNKKHRKRIENKKKKVYDPDFFLQN